MAAPTLYQQVVDVTQEFLGPAAERFIERLVGFHLNKKPDELVPTDIPKLTEWIKVSLGLLTSDKAMVDDCEKKILKLSLISK